MTDNKENNQTLPDNEVLVNEDAEQEILTDEVQKQIEEEMTKKDKMKALFMYNKVTSIIKWSCCGLGLIALIFYIISICSSSLSEKMTTSIYKGFVGFLTMVFNAIPISVGEIVLFATILGILAYLTFIIIRSIQVKNKYKKGGLWIQFGYSLVATASIFAIFFSLGYGIALNREKLYTKIDYAPEKTDQLALAETSIWLIDKLNSTVYDAVESDAIFFKANGFSKYAKKNSSTPAIAKAVAEAFKAAGNEIPELSGRISTSAKELLLSPLYAKMQLAGVYSPVTGEVNVNHYYAEVSMPMIIAKATAKELGYLNDSEAEYIAYLVLTQYTDDLYLNYSAYFNAYLKVGARLFSEDKNKHYEVACALRGDIKKEIVKYTKDLDEMYSVTSSLQYTEGSSSVTDDAYNEFPKLMLKQYREKYGSETYEEKSYGTFVNYIVNTYKADTEFESAAKEVQDKYTVKTTTDNSSEKAVG